MLKSIRFRNHRELSVGIALAAVIVLVTACSGGGSGGAITDPVVLTDMGIGLLNGKTESGLVGARDMFRKALDNDPTNQRARFLSGATGLGAFLEDDDEDEGECSGLCMILNGFGVGSGSRSLYNYGAVIPGVMPVTSPTGTDIQNLFKAELLPAVQAAAADFELVMPNFTTTETIYGRVVEFDYADAQLIASFLRLVEAGILVTCAFDLDFDIDAVANGKFGGEPYAFMVGPTIAADPSAGLLAPPRGNPAGLPIRPGFLNEIGSTQAGNLLQLSTLANANLASARVALIASIDRYLSGMTSLRAETDPQADDLLSLSLSQDCESATLELWLADLRTALQAGLPGGPGGMQVVPAQFSTLCSFDVPHLVFDTTAAFTASSYGNRIFLPNLSAAAGTDPTRAVATDFTDPTLGGSFPNVSGGRLAKSYNWLADAFESSIASYQARSTAVAGGPKLESITVQGISGPIYANGAGLQTTTAAFLNSRIVFDFDMAVDPSSLPLAPNFAALSGIIIIDGNAGTDAQGSFAVNPQDPTQVFFDPSPPTTANDCLAGLAPATTYIVELLGSDVGLGSPLTFSGQSLAVTVAAIFSTGPCGYLDQVPGPPVVTFSTVDFSAGVATVSMTNAPNIDFDFSEPLLPSTGTFTLVDISVTPALPIATSPLLANGSFGVSIMSLQASAYSSLLTVGHTYQIDLSMVSDLAGNLHVVSPMAFQIFVTP